MSLCSAPELDGPLSAVLTRDGDGRTCDEYLGLDDEGEGRPGTQAGDEEDRMLKCRD